MATKKIDGFNFDFQIIPAMTGRGRKTEMIVSISESKLYISKKASKFLTKEHVEIGYDEKKKAIAIQPSEETDISKKLIKQRVGRIIFSKKLVKLIEKDAGDRKKFPCRWDEKEQMLIFNLEGEK